MSERSAGSRGTYTQSFKNPPPPQIKVTVHFLPIEEIAIVVQHQVRQNQVQLVTSYSIGRPVLLLLRRWAVVSQ
ncbi:hypothetical protein TNCV_4183591 [Trichonephila clavipes]|nr:hypothetical protein TNCV_4183591 [Trichonephila clavipes]